MNEKTKLLGVGAVLLLGFMVVVLGGSDSPDSSDITPALNESVADGAMVAESEEKTQIRVFTALEFKNAYDNLTLPNITPIISQPEITGNLAADDRIRAIAEQRGYLLRDVTSGLLNEIEGEPVQELLIEDWEKLTAAASDALIDIRFESGYRSIDDQRDIFMSRLSATGVSLSEIAQGKADSTIDQLLQVTAPPGYSRHHSGYTIDVADPGFSVFEGSDAYEWISANNYEVAKQHGFIPSYPAGLTNQGPNPEPWEYVWVGKGVTYE